MLRLPPRRLDLRCACLAPLANGSRSARAPLTSSSATVRYDALATAPRYSPSLQPLATATRYSHSLQPLDTATRYSPSLQPLATATRYSHSLQPFATATRYSHSLQPLATCEGEICRSLSSSRFAIALACSGKFARSNFDARSSISEEAPPASPSSAEMALSCCLREVGVGTRMAMRDETA